MTSDMSFTSKLSDTSNLQLAAYSTPNGATPSRLLSPISEHSIEIQTISLPIDKNRLDSNENIAEVPSNEPQNSVDLSISVLLSKFHHYKSNFQKLRTFFHSIDEHLNELKKIIDQLESDRTLSDLIEPIPTRLIQIRVKVDQIDRFLNSSIIEKIHREISPYVVQFQMQNHYPDLISSIQMSLNQKTTLIDHLNNEHRYLKYFINDYATKLKQRQEILLKFTERLDETFARVPRRTSLEKKCQQEEFVELVKEYEEVQEENVRLREETEAKLRRCSSIVLPLDPLPIE